MSIGVRLGSSGLVTVDRSLCLFPCLSLCLYCMFNSVARLVSNLFVLLLSHCYIFILLSTAASNGRVEQQALHYSSDSSYPTVRMGAQVRTDLLITTLSLSLSLQLFLTQTHLHYFLHTYTRAGDAHSFSPCKNGHVLSHLSLKNLRFVVSV